MANRFMYDSYDGSGIPADAEMVAGYPWWTDAAWHRFAGKRMIRVVPTVKPVPVDYADVLDVERGDATPEQTEAWIRERKDLGYFRPTIYCNLSNVAAVRVGTGPFILGVHYNLWVAAWDGQPKNVYPGASAHQYVNQGTQYDLSVVFDPEWPHRRAPRKR